MFTFASLLLALAPLLPNSPPDRTSPPPAVADAATSHTTPRFIVRRVVGPNVCRCVGSLVGFTGNFKYLAPCQTWWSCWFMGCASKDPADICWDVTNPQLTVLQHGLCTLPSTECSNSPVTQNCSFRFSYTVNTYWDPCQIACPQCLCCDGNMPQAGDQTATFEISCGSTDTTNGLSITMGCGSDSLVFGVSAKCAYCHP